MIQNNAAIGVTFSGEASQMLEKMKIYAMWYRLRPATFGLDNMVIPKQSKTKMQPMPLSTFMLKPENASKMRSMSVIQLQTYQLRNCSQREKKRRQGLLSRC